MVAMVRLSKSRAVLRCRHFKEHWNVLRLFTLACRCLGLSGTWRPCSCCIFRISGQVVQVWCTAPPRGTLSLDGTSLAHLAVVCDCRPATRCLWYTALHVPMTSKRRSVTIERYCTYDNVVAPLDLIGVIAVMQDDICIFICGTFLNLGLNGRYILAFTILKLGHNRLPAHAYFLNLNSSPYCT